MLIEETTNWNGSYYLYVHVYGKFTLHERNSEKSDPHNFAKLYRSYPYGQCYKHRMIEQHDGIEYEVPYYTFVHNEYERICKPLTDRLLAEYEITGWAWFSQMGTLGQLFWHTDKYQCYRLHYVVENNGIDPSVETRDDAIFAKPGETFTFDPSEEHRVFNSSGHRLHLVASARKTDD